MNRREGTGEVRQWAVEKQSRRRRGVGQCCSSLMSVVVRKYPEKKNQLRTEAFILDHSSLLQPIVAGTSKQDGRQMTMSHPQPRAESRACICDPCSVSFLLLEAQSPTPGMLTPTFDLDLPISMKTIPHRPP